MNKRTLALLAAFAATAIYGINHTIAKDVMPDYIKPYGFILLRVTVAALLFWLVGLGIRKEKIAVRDWWQILSCSFFGMVLNMLSFFKGLSLTTPINSSVIMTITPILVLILSALWIKEKITLTKTAGIVIGIAGALLLILYGAGVHQNAANVMLGNSLVLVNATAYGIYLIMVKPLAAKYHPFTLLKWMFLISIFMNLPFTLSEFGQIDWGTLPSHIILKIVFVVVGTTFLTYTFNTYALKQLKASTLSVFIYLQPLVATIYAMVAGSDSLDIIKVTAAFLVFSGVYLVTKKTAAA